MCFSTPEEAQKARDSLNGNDYHGKKLNVCLALSKEECARKLEARFAPQLSIDNNRYLPSFYGNQSFLRSPVYDRPYWLPNVYGRMQNLKPKSHHQEQKQKVKWDGSCFLKGSLGDENVKRAKLQKVLEQVIGNNGSHGYK